AQPGGGRAGALRGDGQRLAPVQRRLERRQGGDGAGRIGAVDEDEVGQGAEDPQQRVGGQLLLAHPGEVPADQRHDHQRVDVALVVEDEHGGPVRPQVLGAGDDVDVDAGEGEGEVAAHGDHRVDGVVAAAVEESDPCPGEDGGEEAPGGGDVADHVVGGGEAPPGEAVDGPAPPAGDPLQSLVGVGGTGVAHRLQQGDVLVAVGVGETGGEVDAAVGGEGLHSLAFAFPPQVSLGDGPGQDAVLHLQAGAEDVLVVDVVGLR